ncbi:glycosyltransferase [Lewinella sp. LCG006]|uniref:glycosyltransferase n=1 Tax=Lewinella sp. LCG006 TaxID=3231911 RepID=UPI00346130D7
MISSTPMAVKGGQERAASLPPIVCVGFPRWEGADYLSSTVQLMGELARKHRVLYVDYPFTYKDVWGNDEGVPRAALSGETPALQERILAHGGKVQLLRLPPFLPANFLTNNLAYDAVLAWNAQRAARAIRKALKQLAWENPIVINAFNPALGNALAGKLNEQLLVYYCYDEISAAPWIAQHGARHEQRFLANVDLTIVSSQGLYDHKKGNTPAIALVKNGVNLDLFKTTGQRPTDVPDGQIIGYVGSVDDRLNYQLLDSIALSYPEVALVFVGRIMAERAARKLATLPNVHLLGPKPPEQLGDYLESFSLGLIPFVKNDLTAGIYPLKINEYLALGLPVVSTNFADLSDFSGFIEEAPNTAVFLKAVARALSGQAPATPSERRNFAAENSWQGRAEKLTTILTNHLITIAH